MDIIRKIKKLVMQYSDLMQSSPAWEAHAYMVKLNEARTLYKEALSLLSSRTGKIRQEYPDFLIILDDIEKGSSFDEAYLKRESLQMADLLERLIGELAVMSIIYAGNDKHRNRLTDLWVYDKCSGEVHKIGADQHDACMVMDGEVVYYNLQCGDGGTAKQTDSEEDGYTILESNDGELYTLLSEGTILIYDERHKEAILKHLVESGEVSPEAKLAKPIDTDEFIEAENCDEYEPLF